MGINHDSWQYWAYGLQIFSEIEVEGFLPKIPKPSLPDQSSSDVVIRLESESVPGDYLPESVLKQTIAVRAKSNQTLELYLKKIGLFRVNAGRDVLCIPQPEASQSQLALALSGIVMAAVLYQRQCFIAHASAIAIQDHAVLFLGDSGAGKSSLALTLHQKGFPILTDDLASIGMNEENQAVLAPALPQIRMTQETAQHLKFKWSDLHPIEGLPKRYLSCTDQFLTCELPIKQIYILKSSDQPIRFEPLPSAQKIMELMHHSEVIPLFSQQKSQHFLTCADLANRVSMHYLYRPKDWSQTEQVIAEIQSHLQAG